MIDTKVSKCYEVSLRYLQIHLMASFLSLFFASDVDFFQS